MGQPVVINLPRCTATLPGPQKGLFRRRRIELKNVKIKLTGGTLEAGFPFPKVSFNFEVMGYEPGEA